MAEQPIQLTVPQPATSARVIPMPGVSAWRVVPIVVIIAALLVLPYVLPSPTTQSLGDRLQPPVGFGGERLGTDGLGRDLLARIVAGTRTSLWVSLVAGTGAAIIGIAAGIAAGLLGGWVDHVITHLVQTVLAVPFISVGLMITATIGQSTRSMIILLITTGWITHAHVLRTQARMLARSEFIAAATAMGASRRHIAWAHMLPNLLPVGIVVFFQQIGSMILWSASLTWLGIGMPIDQISLGGIVRDGQELLFNGWWVSVFGGLAIILVVTSLNLTADWLRHALDPITKGSREA